MRTLFESVRDEKPELLPALMHCIEMRGVRLALAQRLLDWRCKLGLPWVSHSSPHLASFIVKMFLFKICDCHYGCLTR